MICSPSSEILIPVGANSSRGDQKRIVFLTAYSLSEAAASSGVKSTFKCKSVDITNSDQLS